MKKAQTLLMVMFLLAIFGILAGGVTVMWQTDLQSRAAERNGLVAFYLAQAGIERAKVEARVGYIGTSAWINLGGGRYQFSVSDIGGNQRLLRCFGQALSPSGTVIGERGIEVEVGGMGTPPPADDAQVGWTWRNY